MPIYTILFGVVLMAIGIGTYIGSGESASFWAFFLQMILGLLAIGLGVGSIVKKPMRMHLMHAAIILAVMGVLVPTIRFGLYLAELERDQQMQLLRALLTVLFSGAYVYAAVQSFRAARKNRKDQPDKIEKPTPPPANDPPKDPPADPASAE